MLLPMPTPRLQKRRKQAEERRGKLLEVRWPPTSTQQRRALLTCRSAARRRHNGRRSRPPATRLYGPLQAILRRCCGLNVASAVQSSCLHSCACSH